MTEPTLYDRLGGAFAIAAVVDHFSNQLVLNPIVGTAIGKSCFARMAHEQPRQDAGPQVHADTLGLQCHRRTV